MKKTIRYRRYVLPAHFGVLHSPDYTRTTRKCFVRLRDGRCGQIQSIFADSIEVMIFDTAPLEIDVCDLLRTEDFNRYSVIKSDVLVLCTIPVGDVLGKCVVCKPYVVDLVNFFEHQ